MRSLLSALLLSALAYMPSHKADAQNATDIKPTPQQLEWQDLEFGAIIHFGTNTFLDREWGDGSAPPGVFNPDHVDTDQWMEASRAAGIRYVVLVAKHHDGFALWPSAQTDYGVKNSPWLKGKGDLVESASASARSRGLRFGVYLSPWDRHEPRYAKPEEYDKYYLAQLEELSTNYGPLQEFWLDGAGSAGRKYDFDTIIQHLRTYQPNALVFADVDLYKYADLRWVGTESGQVPYENWNVVDRAGYLRWRPVEADTPLHKDQWFWHPNADSTLKTVEELVDEYNQTVGRGAQLMLGLAPDRTGRIPASDVARLTEFGARIRAIYGKDLAVEHTALSKNLEAAVDGDTSTYWTAGANESVPTLTVTFQKPTTIDRVMTMERLNDGQHVEEYAVEALANGAWTRIAHAYAIGHKKIDIFTPIRVEAVRLMLLQTSGQASIREFQAFNGAVSDRADTH